MEDNRKRKRLNRLVSCSPGTYSKFEIHQDNSYASNKKEHHQIDENRKRCRRTNRSLSNYSGILSDDKNLKAVVISKVDNSALAIPERKDKNSLVLARSKCQWTSKKRTGLLRENSLIDGKGLRVSIKEDKCCEENGVAHGKQSVKLESSKITIRNQERGAEFVTEDELANHGLVTELLENASNKQQVCQDNLRERDCSMIFKAKDDCLSKKRMVNKQSSKRMLNGLAKIDLETRNYIEEPKTKMLTNRTYIEQNFCPKDLQWKTSLVKVNNLNGNNEKDVRETKDDTSDDDTSSNQRVEGKVKRNGIVLQGYFGGNDNKTNLNSSSKQYILTCSNSQIVADFKSSDRSEPPECRLETKNNKSSDKCGERFIDYVDNHKASSYNIIPSSSLSSSSCAKQASTYSHEDRFDGPSSRMRKVVKSTKSSTSSSSHSPSLRNLRMIVERNLVATLIGLYILVSLTVITILMLPYLFNFQRGMIENNNSEKVSQDILNVASYEQTVNVNSIGIKQPGQIISDSRKGTIQQVVTNQDSTKLLVHKLEINKTTTTSLKKGEQQVATGGNKFEKSPENVRRQNVPAPTSERQSSPMNGQVDKSNQQHQDRSQSSRKRGTRVSPTKDEESKSTNVSQLPPTSKAMKDKFNGWWNVAHNEICQPLKIAFCNKSYSSMFPQVNSYHQHQAPIGNSIPYDKTLLPNQFSLARQSQIERVLQRYEPIIDIKCYALMPLFLCSIYAPKCIKLNQTQVDRHFISKPLDFGQSSSLDPDNDQEDVEGLYFVNQLAMAMKRPTPTAHLINQNASKSDNWSRLVPPCQSLCKGKTKYLNYLSKANKY